MIKKIKSISFLLMALCFISTHSYAQKDTSKRQTIEITSSYKPSLRNPVKINLSATPITADTSKPRLAYSIPAQNLFFAYQPVESKPLLLEPDTELLLGDRNQLKAGFGNLSTPYISGAFSFGDGKTSLLNLYGDYISSKGKIKYQDFSEMNIKGIGSIFTETSETYFGIGFSNHQYFQYGYDHTLYPGYSKDDLRRSYQDVNVKLGYRNTAPNTLGIDYNPHVEFHTFGRESFVKENTFIFNLPAEKRFGDKVLAKLAVKGNINAYQIKANSFKINNNLFQLAPELVYYSDQFTFHGGATPSWNNNELSVLPNVYAEVQLQKNVFAIQGGWVGRFIENSFRTLSNENPYMQDPIFFKNTKEVQYYGGIKATLGDHFNFNAKAAYISYKNMPLFINDEFDGKSFVLSNESSLSNFQIHGDANYINQDKFTLTAAMDLNAYTGLDDNTSAWGLYPLKLNGSFRWNAMKQLIIKGDLVTFSGAKALLLDKSSKNLKGGTDLSAGGEFKINNMFSAWLDFNNVLNNKYQKWNNYPVYGFQVIGGVIVRF